MLTRAIAFVLLSLYLCWHWTVLMHDGICFGGVERLDARNAFCVPTVWYLTCPTEGCHGGDATKVLAVREKFDPIV